ncbi:bifunctional adenosylcobinamide kinase/adenosylcobinamide-phosphate guanylyltransferase [Robbsia sp. KACC 23696]|uniref:bifunctional adenosylcobinamide kinase/adenosylcobinamide-phosphate guanylyltransferase n=1 Tax=Robbsia sp. KACC 23696 TaxID=3149231 RepID=UPI00325B6DFB
MSVSPVSHTSHDAVCRDSGASAANATGRPRTTFVLGGARSGKSRFAEEVIATLAATSDAITYIATSAVVPGDAAFAERIALHRARRPAAWGLIEADHDLAGALRAADTGPDAIVLIDCLTLWLTRLLCPMDADAPRADWQTCLSDFHDALTQSRGRIVLVSNEIGLGVIPMGALTRLFVDEMGRLNQRVAAACDRVVLTVAGLPLELKGGAVHSPATNR